MLKSFMSEMCFQFRVRQCEEFEIYFSRLDLDDRQKRHILEFLMAIVTIGKHLEFQILCLAFRQNDSV